jgi:hypothetical protein
LNNCLEDKRRGCNRWVEADRRKRTERGKRRGRTNRRREGILTNYPEPFRFER